jgi:hypothetical protein
LDSPIEAIDGIARSVHASADDDGCAVVAPSDSATGWLLPAAGNGGIMTLPPGDHVFEGIVSRVPALVPVQR